MSLHSELPGIKTLPPENGAFRAWKPTHSLECGACVGSALRVKIALLFVDEAAFNPGT